MTASCIETGNVVDFEIRRTDPLFQRVAVVLCKADPLMFIGGCVPEDYAPVVETILRRLTPSSSVNDTEIILHEEFLRWFGAGITGPQAKYHPIAPLVWQQFQQQSIQGRGRN
jgi:hypothetical protein